MRLNPDSPREDRRTVFIHIPEAKHAGGNDNNRTERALRLPDSLTYIGSESLVHITIDELFLPNSSADFYQCFGAVVGEGAKACAQSCC